MDKKTYGIGILFATAIVLLVAQFLPLAPATAQEAVIGRDYALVTAPIVGGGDALYVTDNRTGLIAVFTWDAGRRSLVLQGVQPVAEAFGR